ncbi:phosphoribosylaminoimidazolesuccinocarboxamide synthase [Pseudogracilibacillus sp. ICA-222130]|uniref:phosphoribosylaminoimidazolesuccinocarboxamide synthase n=1 Tax=Pseudogracilibacillus sp. ICA-222130 TaxID=3134655 RepID=UPI0030C4BAE0
MELIYQGKTKDVYKLEDGNIQLMFKDDVTGEDGVFDPGANTVGLTIDGVGKSGLKMTTYFFEKLRERNIPTHYIKTNFDDVAMIVKDAEMFGNGLEVICRYRAVGSFYRRYAALCEEGQALDRFVEITIKDDERGDPPISKEALTMLHVVTEDEYDQIVTLTKEISQIVKETLADKGLELFDIKLEFGRNKETKEIMLIDEISGGNMRVYDKNGTYIEPLQLETYLF